MNRFRNLVRYPLLICAEVPIETPYTTTVDARSGRREDFIGYETEPPGPSYSYLEGAIASKSRVNTNHYLVHP